MKLILIPLKYQSPQLLRVEKSAEGRERLFGQTSERCHPSPNRENHNESYSGSYALMARGVLGLPLLPVAGSLMFLTFHAVYRS